MKKPIYFKYERPSLEELEQLQRDATPVALQETPRLKLAQSYYQQGLRGSLEKTYTRRSIEKRLHSILNKLPLHLGLVVFDAFRPPETQAHLFEQVASELRKKNPHLDTSAYQTLVRQFVAHPNEPSRFEIAPHMSGGAIDLAIFDLSTGAPLDFGTDFDHLGELSATCAFEKPQEQACTLFSAARYEEIRNNRRRLFHLMKSEGFTNFTSEWWHYDLGSCLWAQTLEQSWFYPEFSLNEEENTSSRLDTAHS